VLAGDRVSQRIDLRMTPRQLHMGKWHVTNMKPMYVHPKHKFYDTTYSGVINSWAR
jgi:hypothetical protein